MQRSGNPLQKEELNWLEGTGDSFFMSAETCRRWEGWEVSRGLLGRGDSLCESPEAMRMQKEGGA